MALVGVIAQQLPKKPAEQLAYGRGFLYTVARNEASI
jgi:hypothetical protein